MHFVDRVFAYILMSISSQIWTDSIATLQSRVPPQLQRKSRVVSFVLERPTTKNSPLPRPQFIFWGRLVPQKSLHTALHIIATLLPSIPNLKFQLIGPGDQGQAFLSKLAKELNIESAISFLGPMSLEEIKQVAITSSFYLQTSSFEGMGVSVVEAMQLGLVPIVTPVGEIKRYFHDNVNALIIDPLHPLGISSRILKTLNSPNEYLNLRAQAINTWQDHPLYSDDIIDFSGDLIKH